MKRDMELVRDILLEVEKLPPGEQTSVINTQADDNATIVEHVRIMIDAGLLDGEVLRTMDGKFFFVTGLTWSGHDFLDAIRNDSVWKKVAAKVTSLGGAWTFDIVKELAITYLKDEVGLS